MRHCRRAPPIKQRRQFGVAGDVARLQHRQARGDVLAGHLQRLGHRPHAVVEPNVGVPQRIPQLFGDVADDVGRHVVVQQHQVEVGVRQQLAAAQTAGGDDREAAGVGDADLGGLGGQPELVQVEQRVAQRGRVEVRRTAASSFSTAAAKSVAGFDGPPPEPPIGKRRRRNLASALSFESSPGLTIERYRYRARRRRLRVSRQRASCPARRCGPGQRCRRG